MAHKRSFSEMTHEDISAIQEDILNLEKQFDLFTTAYCDDYNRIVHRARLQDFAMVVILISMWVLIAK